MLAIKNLQYCLELVDQHDLGPTVFSLLNSCSRQIVLRHKHLQRIMSMIQRVRILSVRIISFILQFIHQTIDADVGNKEVLKKIMYDIVSERGILPECLKIDGITWTDDHGNKVVSLRGGFADIFVGMFAGQKVALKRLRNITQDALQVSV